MRKPGQWIATFGPGMKVSRVNVEAAPALDLVQVTTIDAHCVTTNLFHFDRIEAAALKDALAAALDQLEQAAVTDHPRAPTAEA